MSITKNSFTIICDLQQLLRSQLSGLKQINRFPHSQKKQVRDHLSDYKRMSKFRSSITLRFFTITTGLSKMVILTIVDWE